MQAAREGTGAGQETPVCDRRSETGSESRSEWDPVVVISLSPYERGNCDRNAATEGGGKANGRGGEVSGISAQKSEISASVAYAGDRWCRKHRRSTCTYAQGEGRPGGARQRAVRAGGAVFAKNQPFTEDKRTGKYRYRSFKARGKKNFRTRKQDLKSQGPPAEVKYTHFQE